MDKKLIIIFTLILLITGAGYNLFQDESHESEQEISPTLSSTPSPTEEPTSIPSPTLIPSPQPTATPIPPTATPKPTNTPIPSPTPTPTQSPGRGGNTNFKQFSANEFANLSNTLNRPNLIPIEDSPYITGHQQADQRIGTITQNRGYQLQATPVNGLSTISGEPLQNTAIESWRMLRTAAANEGIRLDIISGYRTVERSRDLFITRFESISRNSIGGTYTNQEIASGEADNAINQTLQYTALPGFSKHHTGYTVDIRDLNSGLPYTSFAETQAYQWISANNFENAKRFGFIPSYPFGAANIGPSPEAWEYVWVGKNRLLN